MNRLLLLLTILGLSGCAQWNELSEGEKVGVIVGTTVLIGASIIANSQDSHPNKICISTRSVQTGCGDVDL